MNQSIAQGAIPREREWKRALPDVTRGLGGVSPIENRKGRENA